MTTTTPPGATSAPGGDARVTDVPALADGVELLGELPGSGYREPPALVRRSDGQTIQLTRLLHHVLREVDGTRSYDEIAAAVSAAYGRLVGGDDVRVLVESKLRPLGVLRLADGSQPEVRKANPLLALRFRYVVSDPEVTRRITRPFAVLFSPVVVVLVVAAFLATCWWVLFHEGLASATREALDRPALLLLVVGITFASAGFHEFGHASACRYGGATPGAMGAGLYLVWPAFYTEVSDSYRLGRGGRVRVDLGGLYFNAIVAVGMLGIWLGTHWDALLLVIAAQVLQMVRQLPPFVRFDGYHILADLTGVPDLYSRIKPTLLGLLPHRWHHPQTRVLKPWARAVVTTWVLVVVPMLLFSLYTMVVSMPRVAATAWASAGRQSDSLVLAWHGGDWATAGVRALAVVAIATPFLGSVYMLGRLVRRLVIRVWQTTAGHPVRRGVAGVVALALVAGLAWAWWPDGSTYRPIRPDERGTVVDAVPAALHHHRTAAAGPLLRAGEVAHAPRTVWAASSTPPTKEHPQLALVMVPRTTGGHAVPAGSPAWVFPFNRPGAPGPGGNQAMAVNTEDGSTVYDVAFALVWVTDGSATNTNEAYALASCRDCKTVSVAFQVVLVIGQADVVVPENISAAVNYSCVRCLTYALATQLVITLPRGLSADAMTRLAALWTQIQEFAGHIQDVPLKDLQAALVRYEAQIMAIIKEDVASATASPTATGSPSSTPGASGTTSTTGGTDPSASPSTVPSSASGGSTPQPTSATTAGSSTGTTAPSTTTSQSSPATTTTAPSGSTTPTGGSTAGSTPATTAVSTAG